MADSKKMRLLRQIEQASINGDDLCTFIAANSNLPGPRGNIELAYAFADYVESRYSVEVQIFDLCEKMLATSAAEAPTNHPDEMVPFCAAVALGRIALIDPARSGRVIALLHTASSDPRWRLREGVAMALQEYFTIDSVKRLQELDAWIDEEDPLVVRALLAGIAEPRLLRGGDEMARAALSVHRRVLARIQSDLFPKSPQRDTLVKALCYTLSVVAAAIPDEGFAFMEELAPAEHPWIRKILRENLKKNRLVRIDKSRGNRILGLLE